MIADPNPAAAIAPQPAAQPSTPSTPGTELSATELYQLTLYKWRYSLEAFGFDTQQVRDLMFLKWLHASRRVAP